MHVRITNYTGTQTGFTIVYEELQRVGQNLIGCLIGGERRYVRVEVTGVGHDAAVVRPVVSAVREGVDSEASAVMRPEYPEHHLRPGVVLEAAGDVANPD